MLHVPRPSTSGCTSGPGRAGDRQPSSSSSTSGAEALVIPSQHLSAHALTSSESRSTISASAHAVVPTQIVVRLGTALKAHSHTFDRSTYRLLSCTLVGWLAWLMVFSLCVLLLLKERADAARSSLIAHCTVLCCADRTHFAPRERQRERSTTLTGTTTLGQSHRPASRPSPLVLLHNSSHQF